MRHAENAHYYKLLMGALSAVPSALRRILRAGRVKQELRRNMVARGVQQLVKAA